MLLSGVSVDDRLVRDLAARVGKPLGLKLEGALRFRAKVVGLTKDEKAAVLGALENAPAELRELRNVLVADDNWKLNQRLG
jgi:hypothetical protein